jgi:hypothetical protein
MSDSSLYLFIAGYLAIATTLEGDQEQGDLEQFCLISKLLHIL